MIELTTKDKKLTWEFVVARKFSPFYESIFSTATGRGNFQAIFGYKHFYRRINIDGDLFYCKEDILSEKKRQLKQIKNNIKLAAKRSIQAEKEGEKLMALAHSIKNKKFEKLTNEQIKNLLLKFFDGFRRFIPFLMMPITVESYLEEEVDKFLAKKYGDDDEKIKNAKSVILTSAKNNLQEKEQLAILKLAQEFKKQGKLTNNLKEKIGKHIDNFGMLGLRYGIGDIWKTGEIEERIKLLSRSNPQEKYNKLICSKEKSKKQLEKVIKELKPDKYISELIRVIRGYIFLRTYRTNILNNSLAVLKPFLEKVAERLNIDFATLNYITLFEILDSLKTGTVYKKFLQEAGRRKKGFGSIFINNQFIIFTGREIQDVVSQFNLKQKISQQNIIKGAIANPGKIKGIVRILYSPEDNQKVKRGDILVTSMTTPNFISAMEKAGAFVTDEGGILCHAAIVSREMNKPCIIGTKIATKVLKDGDLVEVDTNRGVVRILERKK